jgi:hypothetical protein
MALDLFLPEAEVFSLKYFTLILRQFYVFAE